MPLLHHPVPAYADTPIVAQPGVIAFYRGLDVPEEIYVMNSDGSDQTNISNNNASDADPSFSPDGSKIAFTSFRDGNYEIYVMNSDGSDQTNISNNASSDYYPNWSPDGTKIAFTRFIEDVHNEQVYVMNPDGSGQTRLTTDDENPESRPSFSPDGSKIAFTSFRDGNYEVYVMDADGDDPTNLSNHSSFDSDSTWSPDGSQIAFASFRDDNFEVYVMDSDGSDQTNLSNNDAWDALPAWSPDGSQIAFHSNRDGTFQVYLMNADGTDQTNVSNNPFDDSDPSWVLPAPEPSDTIPPNHPPLSDLVSWYRAEENANDSIDGNDGNGDVSFGAGQVGQAFAFDGVDDRIVIPHSATLNPADAITIDGWVMPEFSDRPAVPNDVDTIFAKIAIGTGGYVLFVVMDPTTDFLDIGPQPIGTLAFQVTTGGIRGVASSITVPNDGAFHHVAGTYDGVSLSVFIDGDLVGEEAVSGSIAATTVDAEIGALTSTPPDRFSHARIDEVSLHSRALSAAEIQSTFEAGTAVQLNSGDASTTSPTVELTLTCTDAESACERIDVTFENIDANINDGAIDTVSIDVSSDSDPGGDRDAVETGPGTGIFQLTIVNSSDDIEFSDGEEITAIGTFFDEVPGTKSVDVVFTDAADNFVNQGDSIILEGAAPADNSPPNHPPLSDLVSWYRAEENPLDSAGNNDGVEETNNGGVDYVPGKIGQAFNFGNDWVEIGNDPTLNFGTGSFTVDAWINSPDNSQQANMIVHGASGESVPSEAGWELGTGPGTGPYVFVGENIIFDIRDETGQAAGRPIVSAPAPSEDEWHHIAAVVDRENDALLLYIDGEQVDSDPIPPTFGSLDNDGNPAIGAQNRGGVATGGAPAGFFSGSIDEVAFHSRALSAAEIQSTFDAGNAVLINSGDATTISPTVELTLTCSDAESGCDTIDVMFENADADLDVEFEDEIDVAVHSTTNTDPIVLQAQETGSSTEIFNLELFLTGEGASIDFNNGDTITVAGTLFDAESGIKTVEAIFTDGDGNSATQSDSIELVSVQPTMLTLNQLSNPTATTGFTASGVLTAGGEGLSGEEISFTGNGGTPLQSVTTGGITFTGSINLVSCPTPVEPTEATCTTDNIGSDDVTSNNIVLHLAEGGTITFPPGSGTVTAKLYLQDMGTSSFSYIVEEDNGAEQDEETSAGALSPVVAVVNIISGYTDGEPNGIREITITEGSVGIAAILTGNPDGLPIEQHKINFEEFPAGAQDSPFEVNPGFYFSTGFAQELDAEGLEVIANFEGSSGLLPSVSETQTYDVLANTAGTGGEGSQSLGGAVGTSLTSLDCNTDVGSVDSDNDGICDIWEIAGVTLGTANYPLLGANVGQADIFVEIDCMTGFCPTDTDLSKVVDAFEAEGFTLHISVDENNLAAVNPLHVWTDTDGSTTNDFANIKNNKFGTSAERGTAGGTLGQGRDYLEAKAQVYHYGLFARNINTGTNTACGPSGQAELRGNDFIVSVGCTGANGFANNAQERQGTLMHEIGHNLGLRHGGGDDTNCKPNLISVMNYARQMPWASLSATTGAGAPTEWSLTYSRQDLANLVETNLQEASGLSIDTNHWTSGGTSSLASGSTSFKIIWGIPAIKTGATGGNINWNNVAGNTASLNINTLSGMTGCSGTTRSTLQSYDEWDLLDLNFRDEGSIDGVQYPDPDTIAELTPAVFEGAETASVVGPNNVFNNAGISILPDVATDASNNNIYVVWSEKAIGGGSNFEIYFSRSADGGVTFTPPENISSNNADSLTPRVAVLNGIIYVVWSDKTGGTSGNYDIRFSKSSDMGDNWDASVKLSSNAGDSLTPSIATFGSDIYVVWSDKTGGTSGKYDIQFKKSTDGGTSFAPAGASGLKVSNNAGDSLTPVVGASATGIFVVWSDTSGGTSGKFDILLKKSTDGGATFLPNTANAKNISANSGHSLTPSLAVDGQNIYVTWSDTTGGKSGNFDILFKKSTDGGATFLPNTANAKNISTTSGLSTTPRVVASSGSVYIAWSEFKSLTSIDIFVRKSGDSGENFDAAINISNNNRPSITPAIALVDPVLHLVWGDLTPGITGDILFASRII